MSHSESIQLQLVAASDSEDTSIHPGEDFVGTITRPLTIASSTATLCDLADKEVDKVSTPTTEHPPPIPEHASEAHSPIQAALVPKRHTSNRRRSSVRKNSDARPPPPPPPTGDVIGMFDPASVGGGGPLKRIETQRSERYQQEEREKAEREAAGDPERAKSSGGGILKRFRSGSTASKRKPITISTVLPPHAQEHEEDEASPDGHGSHHHRHWLSKHVSITSPALSHKSSLSTPGEKRMSYDFGMRSEQSHSSQDGGDGEEVERAGDSRSIEEGGEDEEDEYVYPDGGYGWVIIICCATLSGCTLGWGMINGTLLEYYETVFPDISSSVISISGTASAFCMCISGFFAGRMGDRYGFKRILFVSAGITWIGLFLAGWCNSFWQLILTQGIITGSGQGLAVPMFMSLPSQWFYKRRGAASGMAIGGAGIGGGIANLVVRQLLTAVGYKKTFIIMSCVNTFFTVLSILLIRTRPRSPEAQTQGNGIGKRPWVDMDVVKTSAFWALGLGLICSTTGYAMPFNFLGKWMRVYLPDESGLLLVLPVVLLAFTLCIGRGLVGLVADLIGPINTFILVFFLSGILQFALWLTARSFASILAFSILFGLIAPGFLGLVPQVVVQIFGSANLATNVGLILLFNGPGNFIAGPLGGAIFDQSGGTSFKNVIVTAGSLQILGALITCWVRYKASKKLYQKV